MSARGQPLRELPQTDGAVEDARAGRQSHHGADDHPQTMLVTRAEHLGLRAPGVRVSFGQSGTESTLTRRFAPPSPASGRGRLPTVPSPREAADEGPSPGDS